MQNIHDLDTPPNWTMEFSNLTNLSEEFKGHDSKNLNSTVGDYGRHAAVAKAFRRRVEMGEIPDSPTLPSKISVRLPGHPSAGSMP